MEIRCDTCEAVFKDRGPTTETSARVAGWGIWRGLTHGGAAIELKACPTCRNDKRRGSLAEHRKPPEGSQPLF